MAVLSSINASTWKFTHGVHSEVEVGDVTNADFKPHAKIKKWGDECWLSVLFPSPLRRTTTVSNGVITWDTPAVTIKFYTFDPTGPSNDGSFEYELVLKNPPPSNTITLNIQTQWLSFYYQPPLTPEEIARGCVRPDNVVGSYAVYHATKGNIHSDETEAEKYKAGKAFHFYRPELIDALGNRSWADMSIDTVAGTMTITASQAFLDSATYPVVVDPNFGYETAGGSTATLEHQIEGGVFTGAKNL